MPSVKGDATGELIEQPGYGLVTAAGTTVPTDGTPGYAHGCIFRKLDGTSGDDAIYVNVGNGSACDFDAITDVAGGGIPDAAAVLVHNSTSTPYSTINAAVTAAASGDLVYVQKTATLTAQIAKD